MHAGHSSPKSIHVLITVSFKPLYGGGSGGGGEAVYLNSLTHFGLRQTFRGCAFGMGLLAFSSLGRLAANLCLVSVCVVHPGAALGDAATWAGDGAEQNRDKLAGKANTTTTRIFRKCIVFF